MLAAFNWRRIKKVLVELLYYTVSVLWVWYAGCLQMDEDKEAPGKCSLTYAAVLRIWYAGCLQMNEDKEVPKKVLSYLCRCPQGLVCWQLPNG
jgi:hypothetical protein